MFPLVSTIVEGFELLLVLLAQTLGGHLGAMTRVPKREPSRNWK